MTVQRLKMTRYTPRAGTVFKKGKYFSDDHDWGNYVYGHQSSDNIMTIMSLDPYRIHAVESVGGVKFKHEDELIYSGSALSLLYTREQWERLKDFQPDFPTEQFMFTRLYESRTCALAEVYCTQYLDGRHTLTLCSIDYKVFDIPPEVFEGLLITNDVQGTFSDSELMEKR
jgi:hypothetical protein